MLPSSGLQLPLELISEILRYLDPNRKPQGNFFVSVSPPIEKLHAIDRKESLDAIRQCMLVSQAFYGVARPVFFHKLSLEYKPYESNDRPSSLRLYQDVFLRKPEIVAEVREVEFVALPHQVLHGGKERIPPGVLPRKVALERSLRPPKGGQPWKATVSILRMLADISDSVNSRGGVERLVLKSPLRCPLRFSSENEEISECWDLEDPVIFALMGIRTSKSLKTLTILDLSFPPPALLFGDCQTDGLEVLQVKHNKHFAFSTFRKGWEGRLSVGTGVLSAQAKRAVESWTIGPTAQRPQSMGSIFPMLKVLSTKVDARFFLGYINLEESMGLNAAEHRPKQRAFLRLQTLQTANYDIADELDFPSLENLEIYTKIWEIRSKHVFEKLRTLKFVIEEGFCWQSFEDNAYRAKKVQSYLAALRPTMAPRLEQVIVRVILCRKSWQPIEVDLSRFTPWLTHLKDDPMLRLDFRVSGSLGDTDVSLCSTVDGVEWLRFDVEDHGSIRARVLEKQVF